MNTQIMFYKKNELYYEFSNFYPVKIIIDGVTWLSSEHYFQSMKFSNKNVDCETYFDILQKADSPMKIFALARQKLLSGYGSKWVVNKKEDKRFVNDVIKQYEHVKIRTDWDIIKEDVMYKVLLAKFTQHVKLRKLLISTGTYELIENSTVDAYWGIGKDGNGLNILGKLLQKVRLEFVV